MSDLTSEEYTYLSPDFRWTGQLDGCIWRTKDDQRFEIMWFSTGEWTVSYTTFWDWDLDDVVPLDRVPGVAR